MTPESSRKVRFGMSLAAGLLFGGSAFWAVLRQPGDSGGAATPADSGVKARIPREIRVEHDGPCPDRFALGKRCGDDSHWRVRIGGRAISEPEDLRGALRKEANPEWSGRPGSASSAQRVMIAGPDGAPWGYVQRLMKVCAQAGIYQIDWNAARPGKKGTPVLASIPQDWGTRGLRKVVVLEIRVFMKWDPGQEATIRKVGNPGMVESDEDLMNPILQMVRDWGKAGHPDPPILIDATADVPWRDVIHVVELCRKEHLRTIEFEPPVEDKEPLERR